MEKRTNIDFSKHELIIQENELVKIHWLKIPETVCHNIKFINIEGKLLVTGDYGNWIFDRNFTPNNTKEKISDNYWCEKLTLNSAQKVFEFDSEETEKELKELINSGLEEKGYEGTELEEAKEYYQNCLRELDYEIGYTAYSYQNIPSFMDSEDVVYIIKHNNRLDFIFDAFEEICNRLNNLTEKGN